jgi:hypothetical protein
MTRESDIEKHLIKRVAERGGHAYKFRSPQRNGVPDRICILPRHSIIFCELKAPGEAPRPDQAREHQRLRDLGCKVLVLDTKQQVDHYFDSNCRYFDL